MSNSQKNWILQHPNLQEERKRKSKESLQKFCKKVAMIDLNDNSVKNTFNSIKDAGKWVLDNNLTSSKNPRSAICAVCKLKTIEKHGTRKSAFGFGWKYIE